ncbi:MAG: type V CRISPR-associated protein Cas12b [Verrucomicrobiae bacterium]|nr:type V CRISPR-associated protein Cas12b [Verrucomicrobiae bacterium]
MNRIYQGKVTNVKIQNGLGEWSEFDTDSKQSKAKWEKALWEHHELFQDAVNYYTLALAAMAGAAEDEQFQKKWLASLADRPEAGNSGQAQLRALVAWRARIRETWGIATRRAVSFEGPQHRLAPWLKLAPEQTGFDQAAKAVLRTSRATPAQRAAAVIQLLTEKGDLNKICVARLPWFATAAGKIDATSKAADSLQKKERQKVVCQFRNYRDDEACKQAASLDLGRFLTQPPKKSIQGSKAVKMLRNYFKTASEKRRELRPEEAAFEEFLRAKGETLSVPLPGRKPSGPYPVAVIFKFWPNPKTLAAFREVTKSLAEAKNKFVETDPVADARVDDQPHFEYFTNLALVSGNRDTRAVWFEFDLAAFIEAIKAPRRYLEDTKIREAVACRLRQRITAMEGRGREAFSADDEEESLPGFEDDMRIERLKDIVQNKLAWFADAESETDNTGSKEYEIRERTVRGFSELKKRWRSETEKGDVSEERLREVLAAEQTEHRDDFGSTPLYEELAKPENHSIWRKPGTQSWHAEDPLAAWLDYKELQAELRDKERPIRFTPAHPVHSPRYFIFPKKSEAKPRTPGKHAPKPSLLSHHDSGQLSFTAGIVRHSGNGLMPAIVRIHYSAPRLCRDNLRSAGDTNLYEAPWLQPMMAALGLDHTSERVNFANCRIALQPLSVRDIQLTFPVEVSSEKIQAAVTQGKVWEKQFNLHPDKDSFYNATLRWPHEKQPLKPPAPWHDQVSAFRCLATDLGQRDAGAFVRLLAASDNRLEQRPTRFIGTTDGKQWHAALERSGLFRLPGEDALVWRKKSRCDEDNPKDSDKPFDYREELWGERGRPARDWEADEAAELMALLKVPTDNKQLSLLPDNWRNELSFPEQNDKLLVAIRRNQSRISRLHRWCWFLKTEGKQKESAFKEIAACKDARLISQEQCEAAKRCDPCLLAQLEAQLRDCLQRAPELLVRIANRVLPLRGRSWRWEKLPAATEENPLHQLAQTGSSLDRQERPIWLRGQRGLSLERIEQIEELRKRCQSLNQMLRREIGEKPPSRRDESVPDPCPDLLEKLDHLKEQRVNQTAHMILAEALGLRLAPPPDDKKQLLQKKDQHGVYQKIQNKSKEWIGAVDFIVIEDLSRYRASQGRAPRENSRLMKWCHRAVRDKLKQLCEVFGLPVLETPAAYSSRFCSRCGAPGFRAVEVAAGFTKTGQWAWLTGKKDDRGEPTEEAKRLLDLDSRLVAAQKELERDWQERKKPGHCPKRTLLVPWAGGPVFVPVIGRVDKVEIQPAIVQADINAAINLALRAIANPKVWSIHPRLRTQRKGGDQPAKGRKTMSRPVSTEAGLFTREKRKFGENGKLLKVKRSADAKADDTRQPNFFADVVGLKDLAQQLAKKNREHSWLTREWTSASIADENDAPTLIHSKSFWGCVKAAQEWRIQQINETRLSRWRDQRNLMPD